MGRRVELAIAGAVVVAFLAYYGLAVFRVPWSGDMLRYLAGVAELLRAFPSPGHEALPLSGDTTILYTPYALLAAGLAAGLDVSPYRGFQLLALVNLALYPLAIAAFFRARGLDRGASFGAVALFLVVSLALRHHDYSWSSETSLSTLRITQAYPSFLAWSLALFAFALAGRARARPPKGALVAVALLAAFTFAIHPLTGSWLVGVIVAQALAEPLLARLGARPSPPLGPAFALTGVAVVGVALAQLWPYAPRDTATAHAAVRELNPFGDKPFSSFAGLYALLPLALVVLARARRLEPSLAIGFAATLAAYLAFRGLGIDYGDRYVFFLALFPQVALVEALRLGPNGGRLVWGGLAVATAALVVASPGVREGHDRRPFLGPAALMARPPSEAAYGRDVAELSAHVGPDDLVLFPESPTGWTLAAVTGARLVWSRFAYNAPDWPSRQADTARFFDRMSSNEIRAQLLDRWRPTAVVLEAPTDALRPSLTALLGPPKHTSARFEVYRLDAAPPCLR